MNNFPLQAMELLFNQARSKPQSTFDALLAQVSAGSSESSDDQIQYYYSPADMYVAFEMSKKKNGGGALKYKTFGSFFASFKPVIEVGNFN